MVTMTSLTTGTCSMNGIPMRIWMKMAGIMIDNDTLRVPNVGDTKYLTIGYYDNGTSVRHISFRELLGPNTGKGITDSTDSGIQSHTAFYYSGGTAQDNITAFWGASDNLSNLLIP